MAHTDSLSAVADARRYFKVDHGRVLRVNYNIREGGSQPFNPSKRFIAHRRARGGGLPGVPGRGARARLAAQRESKGCTGTCPPRTDREPRGGEDDRLTVRVRTLVLGRAHKGVAQIAQ